MRKVVVYSLLLVLGLGLSQALPLLGPGAQAALGHAITLLTMVGLAFIMIHVGLEFELDKGRVRAYGWDYLVAATAAAFPWLAASLYFVFVLAPQSQWGDFQVWKEALLQGRFASPTSAGVLFAMLAAAGLGATWVFHKARVLAIFDDLDTILLMVPLTVLLVGFRWQLLVLVSFLVLLLALAWRFLGRWRIPCSWPWVLGYAVALTGVGELVVLGSRALDPSTPVHLEVLLPAFALGCVMARPPKGLHEHDSDVGQEPGLDTPKEQRVATLVSAVFMVLVGLSMPPVKALMDGGGDGAGLTLSWGAVALHVFALTVLINLGKMVPAFCYRAEASRRERLALAVALFPRGEVGAGVLVLSLGYGIGGAALLIALLSLVLNLLLTGAFIVAVRRLINHQAPEEARPPEQPVRRPPAPRARPRTQPVRGLPAHRALRGQEGG